MLRSRLPLHASLLLCFLLVPEAHSAEQSDVAEVRIGERLFLETRFAQAFFKNQNTAEPVLRYTLTLDDPLPGPFAGKTMNCRNCHLVNEHNGQSLPRVRSYADFTHTSPVPKRQDGENFAARNAMSLVNIALRQQNALFHFDGEFNSMEDLVQATLTGRNYGWLVSEKAQAIKHIAQVIRNDDGKGALAQQFGGAYRSVLAGTDTALPVELRLPANWRLNVTQASDQEIVATVARLISAYVKSLNFSRDKQQRYNASPYDAFLKANRLPQQPAHNESAQAYAQHLLQRLGKLRHPVFITEGKQTFKTHRQDFRFGQTELDGLKLFLRKGDSKRSGGNCVSCHHAPDFSDFSFHNTGVSQFSYDRSHGFGAFNKLTIPDLQQRNRKPQKYLPASRQHPTAAAPFRSLDDQDKPGRTDLGLWNIFANPAMPTVQKKIKKLLCQQARARGLLQCSEPKLLALSVASFKTPVLRDLGHSDPYMHNGLFRSLKEAVAFYLTSSSLAQQGQLRNADHELQFMRLNPADFDPLVAFLQSLNEDYE